MAKIQPRQQAVGGISEAGASERESNPTCPKAGFNQTK
jgi:hypothetical protein